MKKISYKMILIISAIVAVLGFLLALLIIGGFIHDPNAALMSLFIGLIIFLVVSIVYFLIESSRAKKFNEFYKTLKYQPDDVIEAVLEGKDEKGVGLIYFYKNKLLFVSINGKEMSCKEYLYTSIRNIKKVNLKVVFKYEKEEISITSANLQVLYKYF